MSLTNGTSAIPARGLVLAYDPSDSRNYTLSEVEVLIVAGGGGGGNHHGGGGGGGGVLYASSYPITSTSAINVTVGNGGGPGGGGVNGINGQNSVFANLTAIGGGGGGTYPNSGSSGGSGGGASNWGTGSSGGSGTVGQGFPAFSSNNGQNNYAGGGGGAGQRGGQGRAKNGGGNGLPFTISGTLRYYGGGGGAGTYPGYDFGDFTFHGSGGLGGGGAGGQGPHGGGTTPIAGATNTGGGGGGASANTMSGASGGSGIVIVRYLGPQKATGGNTITNVNGYTIHTFTSSGTFTPISTPTNGSVLYGLQDLTGNPNTAVSVNSPTYNTTNANSITLSGATNQHLTFGNSLGNDFSEITVQAWVRPTTFPNGNYTYEYLVTADDSGSGSPDSVFSLKIEHHNSPSNIPASFTGNLISFGIRTTTAPYIFRPIAIAQNNIWEQYIPGMAFSLNPPEYALNTWMFLSGTFDGSVTLIYINGQLKGTSNSQPDGVNRTLSGVMNNSPIGRTIGNFFGGGGNFTGNLGPIQIFNRALSSSEISQNFNNTRGRFGI